MKIICVTKTSYKSFYLNYLKHINKCSLLVFNFGIIYDYDVKRELMQSGLVTKELFSLAKSLKAVVIAGVYVVSGNVRKKSIIVCDGEKINIAFASTGAKLYLNKKVIVIGDEKIKTNKTDKIVLTSNRIYPNINHCSQNRTYIFCDDFGTTVVKNKKITRNFNKYSKIILK